MIECWNKRSAQMKSFVNHFWIELGHPAAILCQLAIFPFSIDLRQPQDILEP